MSCLQTMEAFMNDVSSFKQFLSDFCKEHHGQITEDDPLPFRLFNYYLTEEEVEAETLEWSYQYLTANKCPNLLACRLARAVTDDVLSLDLGPFIEPATPSVEEVCDGLDLEESPRDNTPQIEVTKLGRVVFSKLHKVCSDWQQSLPASSQRLPNRAIDVSHHAIKNTRRKMEDRHVTLPYVNYMFNTQDRTSPASYFAVFDGHAGVDAAIYAGTHLHRNILAHTAYGTELGTAIKDALKKTDGDFCKKANRESLRSGSTGVFCMLRENKLHMGWVGDSQMMMVRDGEPVCLMEPHKPEREDERKRIEDLGGCVIQLEGAWRVNGSLSVSRAFGDVSYRPYISADADLRTYDLDGTEDYIVLACDGLWDMVSHDMVVAEVYDYLKESNGDRAGVAKRLVALAKERRSSDNITVIVVFLRDKLAIPRSRSQDDVAVLNEEEEKMMEGSQDFSQGLVGGNSSSSKSSSNLDSKDPCKDVSDSSSRAVLGQSPALSANQMSGNIDSGKLQGGCSNTESPVFYKLKQSTGEITSSPELSNTNTGSKRVLVDLPRLEKLKISSSPNQSSPELSGNQARSHFTPKAPLCESEKSLSDVSSNVSLPKAPPSEKSETSSTDIALMASTATKCLNNRRAKRAKNLRRKNLRELRRSSKEKLSSPLSPHSLTPRSPLSPGGIAHRTNGTPPRSRHGSNDTTSPFLRSSLRLSQQLSSASTSGRPGDHLIEMLTGCSPQVIRKVTGVTRSRWTVAVEIESGSGIFGE